jgi:ankyrin repeat protein
LTDTTCAEVWKAANLNSSNDYTPAVPPSYALQKRKFEEIRQIFDDYESARSSTLSSQMGMAIHLTIILCGTLLLFGLLAAVIFRDSLRKAFLSLLRRLRNIRLRRYRKLTEKAETAYTPSFGTTAVSSSVGFRGDSRATLRLAAPGIRHLPNNIWEVAARGLRNETRALTEQKADFDIDEVHERYGTLLAAAARSGNIDLVADILTWGPDVQREGGHYHNALQSGAYSGKSLVVRKLLDAGARDLSIGGYFGTAVNAAAEKGSSEMLVDILRHTINPSQWVNVPGGLHGKAVIAAASRGQGKMVLDLLAHGASLNDTNDYGTAALHAAAAANHFQMVQALLDRNADKDLVSTIHGTPLHAACRGKFSDIGLLLIKRGASVVIKDQNSRTVLHEASKNGLAQLVDAILITDDSLINAQDADGNTALHHSSIGGHPEITSLLIKHNIDVSIGDKFNAQALFRAAGCHHLEVVRILLEDGKADVNAIDCFNQSALHGPAETDDVSVQRTLIRHGANVNAVGAMHRTVLHEACNMGRYENVKLLLSTPEIKVNVVDDDQTTPLCCALCSTDARHKDECVDQRIPLVLLDYKDLDLGDVAQRPEIDTREDINVNLCNGLAIQEAARKNFIEVVRKMVEEHNANIHLPGGKYGGVLQAAAIGGDVEILKLLLDGKANANLQGGEYGNPLAAAAAYGNVAAVKLLLEYGADPTISGVGRYGSAFNSVCKALKVEEEGPSKIIQLTEQLKEILEASGAELGPGPAGTLHEGDRWQLMTSGWTWNTPGEL